MEANQLQAKDFRLGNKIQDNNGFEMYVVGIFEDEILLDFEGNEGDVFQFTGKEIDLLNPIPLSEDVLLRLGFEKSNAKVSGCDYFVNGKYSVMAKDNVFSFSLVEMQSRYLTSIQFVHNLQNLFFALCGEELTFKN